MKTLLVILGLVIGTTMGANAQTQTKSTSQAKSQPQAQAQSSSQSKSMIKIAELPKPIQDNLSAQFKGWTPMQAYKLDSKGAISYEVMAKKDANEMMLFYDRDGKFLKEEPINAMKSDPKKEAAPAKQDVNKAPAQKPAAKPK